LNPHPDFNLSGAASANDHARQSHGDKNRWSPHCNENGKGNWYLSVTKYRLHFASDPGNLCALPGKPKSKRRSGCPVSTALEEFGDRWSLLIIRDLMVRGYRTFKEFQGAGEGIATNILADRLKRLETFGIIRAEKEKTDGRKLNYRLTEKGIHLAPVLLDLLIWGARHEETGAPCALIRYMEKNREAVLAETRRRWRERDSTPLIPRSDLQKKGGKG
jgi:DNA-binding HxlR family transcriptional regulator